MFLKRKGLGVDLEERGGRRREERDNWEERRGLGGMEGRGNCNQGALKTKYKLKK